MFGLNLQIGGDLDRMIETIGATEAQVRIAAVRAINKTAFWVQSKSAREISAQKKIQLKLIRQKLKVVKANRQSLKAFVMANLYGIKAVKLGIPRQNSSGASVGGHQFPGSFVAKMPTTGHVGIYKRKNHKRLPIQEQYVQLNPEATDIINRTIEDEASEVFTKYFDHEMTYVTKSAQ